MSCALTIATKSNDAVSDIAIAGNITFPFEANRVLGQEVLSN